MSETTTPPGYQRCPSCDTLNNSRRLQCVKCGAELPNLNPVGAPTGGPELVEVTEIAASPPPQPDKALNQKVDQVAGRVLLIGGLVCGAAFALFLVWNTADSILGAGGRIREDELKRLCESSDTSEAAVDACFRVCDYSAPSVKPVCLALAEVQATRKIQAR
jgi:hypothetical protein